MTQITQLLQRMHAGDTGARDALFSVAYKELQQLAQARLRGGGRNTVLETTSLVHETYLRLVAAGTLRAEDRRSFFAYASQVMRSVIPCATRIPSPPSALRKGIFDFPLQLRVDL